MFKHDQQVQKYKSWQTSFSCHEVKLKQSELLRDEMAELQRETLSCSICLDLLKDPVTTTCGHSYCMNCIKSHWDGEDQKGIYSCLQCRNTFITRPVLEKSTMLAALVEELKKTEVEAAAPFKKCKLGEPSKNLQEHICSRHEEVVKIFCRTDQQGICYLCLMDEHKGHDIVLPAAERARKQKELEVSRLLIQQRIQDRERDVELLQQEVENINVCADKAVEDSEKMFTELIRLIQKRSSDVTQQVRSQQETEMSRVKELQEKVQQEINDLNSQDFEFDQLSNTQDDNLFLQVYPALSEALQSTCSSSIKVRPLSYFEDVTAAVSETRDKLQDLLRDQWTNISLSVPEVDVFLSEPEPEPKTRAGFLKYSREITLDPNTANTCLLLSAENRKVTVMEEDQSYFRHPDRFTEYLQVLSGESLTGRCYWEVEWRGDGVDVAVSYKNISRSGSLDECGFGYNDKSWSLRCYTNRYVFRNNGILTVVFAPQSSRVGVYLDPGAGILSFYSVSETMTLLYRIQTTFIEPLHAGLRFYYSVGDSAEFIKMK